MRAFRVMSLAVFMAFIGLFCSAAASGQVVPDRVAFQPALQPAAAAPAAAAPVAAAPAPAAAAPVAAAPAAPAPAAPRVVVPEEAPAPEVALPTTPFRVDGTPCMSTARACVDLSANQAWLIRDGVVEYGPVPTTSGRKGFRTPPGTFKVSFKNRDHVSSIYDAPMPYSVFFNGGIAFHQGSLREKSHGCIHLSRTAAQKFFGTLSRGDVVQVVP